MVEGAAASHNLDASAFAAFGPLLAVCHDYAALTGCRFRERIFRSDAGEDVEPGVASSTPSALRTAALQAAPTVAEYAQRLQEGDEGLLETAERAYRLVMGESVRNGIIATLREFDLWPPRPSPPGVLENDCSWEDTSASLPEIAQRAYNDEARRGREGAFQALIGRAATASFLVDFASEVGGVKTPKLAETHQEMMQEFMSRLEEWQLSGGASAAQGGHARARRALLAGLGGDIETVRDLRAQVQERWSKNWESSAGTAANVAVAGLALVAGYAALRRAASGRR